MTRRADVDLLAKVTARLGDAVVDPAIWPQIMEEICRAFATTGAVLLQSDVRTPDVPRTEAIDEVMKIYFDDDWGARDEIAKYGVPAPFGRRSNNKSRFIHVRAHAQVALLQ